MSEVKCISDASSIQADVISLKSKSNTLHVYEIKTNATPKTINAALWQLKGFYSNYKTLVISKETYYQIRNSSVFETITKYGIGIITFTGGDKLTFKRVKRANYREGTYLEHWPSILAER
ncbi:hypothetical protein [Marivirga sericea]|nr:hypothetical protein [Marivirga sericea]